VRSIRPALAKAFQFFAAPEAHKRRPLLTAHFASRKEMIIKFYKCSAVTARHYPNPWRPGFSPVYPDTPFCPRVIINAQGEKPPCYLNCILVGTRSTQFFPRCCGYRATAPLIFSSSHHTTPLCFPIHVAPKGLSL